MERKFSAGLVARMAEGSGVPESSVRSHFRALRDAGMTTSGRRGRSAPDMTTLDGLRLALALAASDDAASAPKRVQEIEALPLLRQEAPIMDLYFLDRQSCKFRDSMEAVIERVRDLEADMGPIRPDLMIEVERQRAQVFVNRHGTLSADATFAQTNEFIEAEFMGGARPIRKLEHPAGGLEVSARFGWATIDAILDATITRPGFDLDAMIGQD